MDGPREWHRSPNQGTQSPVNDTLMLDCSASATGVLCLGFNTALP